MANKERSEVSFDVQGKTWTMKIGTGAMCEMEDATGKGISELSKELSGDKVKLSLLRMIFWAALQKHHKGTTIEECDDLIDDIGITEAGPLIGRAFQAAFPKAEAKDGKDPQEAAAA